MTHYTGNTHPMIHKYMAIEKRGGDRKIKLGLWVGHEAEKDKCINGYSVQRGSLVTEAGRGKDYQGEQDLHVELALSLLSGTISPQLQHNQLEGAAGFIFEYKCCDLGPKV